MFDDRRAFDSLVRKYQSQVRSFFMNHTFGDACLSDDLAQDTFIKAYTHIRSFRGLSGFSTWLYRIAYNVMYDYRRSHKITADIDTAVTERAAGGADCALRMDIYKALKVLGEAELTCVTLQVMDGQPIDKIVEITGITAGTVKSHLSRGKKKLAAYLKANGYDR